jgi:HSP20 family molecular chaperone IbpA
MTRSIPPRTMREVWRERSKSSIFSKFGSDIFIPQKTGKHYSKEASYKHIDKAYNRPRKWQYITKPFFKRIKEPIIDVFNEAEEVQIVIDLGNFRKGELSFGLKNRKYIISGKHEDCEFYEEILLPHNVDKKNIKENFRNDILLLILPKKKRWRKLEMEQKE